MASGLKRIILAVDIMLIFIVAALLLASLLIIIYLLLPKTHGRGSRLIQQNIDKLAEVFGTTHKTNILLYYAGVVLLVLALAAFGTHIILLLVILVVLCALPTLIARLIKKRRLELFEKQLPDAIDLMAGSLRSGSSLINALALIAEEFPAPVADEIGLIVREQKLGVSVDASLQNFSARMPMNSVILMVSTIRTAMETGGELSDALTNIAKTLRSIEQAEGKIRALTAQGKMQAWVVGLMPVLLIAVLSKMEPAAMSQLWQTKEGYLALTAIIIFELLGIFFIRKIVNIDI